MATNLKQLERRASSVVALITGLWATVAHAQTYVGNRYEVSVAWGSSASSIVSTVEVVAGEPAKLVVGDSELTTTVLPLSEDEYDLQIAVTAEDGLAQRAVPVVNVQRATFAEARELPSAKGRDLVIPNASVSVRRLKDEA